MRAAIVVQRYGNEVLGGAETLARRIAELLAPEIELTVVTTCALDYLTWADHYPPGEAEVNGVRVLRFPCRSLATRSVSRAFPTRPTAHRTIWSSATSGCVPRARTRPGSSSTWAIREANTTSSRS